MLNLSVQSVNNENQISKFSINQDELKDSLKNALTNLNPVKLNFRFDSLEELKQIESNLLVEAIASHTHIFDISITPSDVANLTVEETKVVEERQEQLKQAVTPILARNQLLKHFNLNVKENEEAWQVLMQFWLSKTIGEAKNQETSYFFGNIYDNSLKVLIENVTEGSSKLTLKDLLNRLGQSGFESFVAVLLRNSEQKKDNFNKALIYEQTDKENNKGLTTNQLLDIFIKQRQQYPDCKFPYSKVTLNTMDIITGKNLEKIIDFLELSPEITELELPFKPSEDYTFDKFAKQLEEKKIVAVVKPTDVFVTEKLLSSENVRCLRNISLKNSQEQHKKNVRLNEQPLVPLTAVNNMPTSWHKPRITSNNRKLSLQHEQSVSVGVDTNATIDSVTTTATQRLQQIAQQQQRQQALQNQNTNLNNNIPPQTLINSSNYVDKMKLLMKTSMKSQEISFRNAYMATLWQQLVGEKTSIFDAVSETALQIIMLNDTTFLDGLVLHNLPEGFFVQQTIDKKILCYERVIIDNPNQSLLTAPLSIPPSSDIVYPSPAHYMQDSEALNPDQVEESIKIFLDNFIATDISPDGESPPEPINCLLELSQRLNSKITTSIKEKYGLILNTFKRTNFFALRPIFFNQGPQGLERFLSKLDLLKQKGLLDAFKTAFIDTSVNLRDLATEEAYHAIDELCTLNQNEAAWWIQLTTEQARLTKTNGPLAATVAGFKHFCHEVYSLIDEENQNNGVKIPKSLPNPCRIKDVRNVHVALERILIILKNAVDVKEQLYNLENVSLHQEAAYYAVMHDRFNFVCNEMELDNKKPSSPEPVLSYKVTLTQLTKLAKNSENNSPEIFKPSFFRYLGTQQCIYPFEDYRQVFNEISSHPKLTLSTKNHLLAGLVICMTEQRSAHYAPKPFVDNILEILTKENNNPADLVVETFNAVCNKLSSEHACKPSLLEMAAIIKLLARTENFFEVKNNIKLLNFIKDYGSTGIQALTRLGQRHTPPAPNLTDYLTLIQQLQIEPAELHLLISCLPTLDLTINEATCQTLTDNLISLRSKFPLSNLFNALQQINIADSKDLPNLSFLEELAKHGSFNSESDIFALIKNKYPGVNFTQATYQSSHQDCSQELIIFIEKLANNSVLNKAAKAANFHPGLIIENLKQNKTTVENILEQLNLANLLISESLLLKEFCGIQQKNLLNLVNKLNLSEKTTDELLTPIREYTKSPAGKAGLKSFLNHCKTLKNLLASLGKVQPKTLRDELALVIATKWSSFINPVAHNDFINRLQSLLDNKQFSIQQTSAIVKNLIKADDHDVAIINLLNNIVEKNQPSVTPLFNNLIEILGKVSSRSDLKPLCQAVNQVLNTFQAQLEPFNKNTQNFAQLLAKLKNLSGKIIDGENIKAVILALSTKDIERLPLIITILSALLPELLNKFDQKNVKKLIENLAKRDATQLSAFAQLYQYKPFPDVDRAFVAFNAPKLTADWLAKPENYQRFKERNLKQQLTLNQKEDVQRISKIEDITNRGSLSTKKQKTLFNKLSHLNESFKSIRYAFYSNQQLSETIATHKINLTAQKQSTTKDKIKISALRKQLLACLRESYYRTTGKFPNNSQVLSVLLSIENKGNVICGIQTGEGKSITSALQAAMLWCEGHTVDVCTADLVFSSARL